MKKSCRLAFCIFIIEKNNQYCQYNKNDILLIFVIFHLHINNEEKIHILSIQLLALVDFNFI